MSVNMNIKIKNCPFCGGKSKVYAYLGKYYAKCIKCKTYSAPYDTPEQAAAAWNTRYNKEGDQAQDKVKRERKPIYLCDATKNTKCAQTSCYISTCYINGGWCRCTQYPEYAKTDEQGEPIKASEM